jgi:hypothetical protein
MDRGAVDLLGLIEFVFRLPLLRREEERDEEELELLFLVEGL